MIGEHGPSLPNALDEELRVPVGDVQTDEGHVGARLEDALQLRQVRLAGARARGDVLQRSRVGGRKGRPLVESVVLVNARYYFVGRSGEGDFERSGGVLVGLGLERRLVKSEFFSPSAASAAASLLLTHHIGDHDRHA